MKIIQHKLNEHFNLPNGTFIFDIETTGLSHKYSKVVMISYIYPEDGVTILEQDYIESLNSEKNILYRFIEIVQKFNFAVHYNGYSFVIPFLNKRLEMNKINFQYNKKISIDLYRNLKLSGTLKKNEFDTGFTREDSISGAEFVELYKKFLNNKSQKIMDKLLLHNRDDVISSLILANKNSNIVSEKIINLENELYFISDIILSTINLRVILENINNKLYVDLKVIRLSGVVFFDIGKDFDKLNNKDRSSLVVKYNEKIFIENVNNYISKFKNSFQFHKY